MWNDALGCFKQDGRLLEILLDFGAQQLWLASCMRNMIIENESIEQNLEPLFKVEAPTGILMALSFEALVVGTEQLKNIEQYYSLKRDLVEYLWIKRGLSMY